MGMHQMLPVTFPVDSATSISSALTRTLGSSDIIELIIGLNFSMRARKPLTTSRHVVRPENSALWTVSMVASQPSKAMVGLAPLTTTTKQERKSDIKSIIEYMPCIAGLLRG